MLFPPNKSEHTHGDRMYQQVEVSISTIVLNKNIGQLMYIPTVELRDGQMDTHAAR
jgi:hypothetical protein